MFSQPADQPILVLPFTSLMALSIRQELFMLYPVVEFDRLVRKMAESQDMDMDYTSVAMLMEVAVRSKNGLTTNVSDLVKCLRFGTGPTVHRHLENLVQLKMVYKVKSSTDRRSLNIQLSNAGDALLNSLSALMKKSLK